MTIRRTAAIACTALALAACAATPPKSPLASLPTPCLALQWEPTPEQSARFLEEAPIAFSAYMVRAETGSDISMIFAPPPAERTWSTDGKAPTTALSTVRDPWAPQVARLEPQRLRLGGIKTRGRGLWRAFRSDLIFLGTYDAMFEDTPGGFALAALTLWEPGSEVRMEPPNAFCHTPGDHDRWAGTADEPEPEPPKGRRGRDDD